MNEKLTKPQFELMVYLKALDKLTSGRCYEAIVAKNGQFYNPQPLPSGIRRGKLGECFMNAYHLVRSDNSLTYVEGFARIASLGLPLHHAWAVDKDGNVIDNTWVTPGDAYFGIPFEEKFVNKVILETRVYGVINIQSKTFRQSYWKGEQ